MDIQTQQGLLWLLGILVSIILGLIGWIVFRLNAQVEAKVPRELFDRCIEDIKDDVTQLQRGQESERDAQRNWRHHELGPRLSKLENECGRLDEWRRAIDKWKNGKLHP